MPDQDDGARLGGDYQLGRVHISRQRNGRILHDADVEAVLLQDVIDTPPAGAVHEASMDENDIVDLWHCSSLPINCSGECESGSYLAPPAEKLPYRAGHGP